MVGLCNLTSLYEKINMELLGVDVDEFKKLVNDIETYNKDTIDVFRKILTNIDMALKFKEYCRDKNKGREGTEGEAERTKVSVDRFFRNVEKFMKKYGDVDEQVKLSLHILQCGDEEKKREVNISQLYGLLVQACVRNFEDEQTRMNYARKGEAVKGFLTKLKEKSDAEIPQKVVSIYLRNKSVENVKMNMDNLASNIQRYYSEHTEENLKESELKELHNFYGKIMDNYIDEPAKTFRKNYMRNIRELYLNIIRDKHGEWLCIKKEGI